MPKSIKNIKRGVLVGTLALVMMTGFATTAVAAAKDHSGAVVKQKVVKYKNLKVLPRGHSSINFKNNKY